MQELSLKLRRLERYIEQINVIVESRSSWDSKYKLIFSQYLWDPCKLLIKELGLKTPRDLHRGENRVGNDEESEHEVRHLHKDLNEESFIFDLTENIKALESVVDELHLQSS